MYKIKNVDGITINPKINIHECYKIGNKIFGHIGFSGEVAFEADEHLIDFPFSSIVTYRKSTKINECILYIFSGNNYLTFSNKYSNEKEYNFLEFEFYI